MLFLQPKPICVKWKQQNGKFVTIFFTWICFDWAIRIQSARIFIFQFKIYLNTFRH